MPHKRQPEDGYQLWLRYTHIENGPVLNSYKKAITQLLVAGSSPTMDIAKAELLQAFEGLFNTSVPTTQQINQDGTLIIGTSQNSDAVAALNLQDELEQIETEGYLIITTQIDNKNCIVITANTDRGVLYGVFHFLRLLQTHKPIENLHIISQPRIKYRMLNHWDNLDGTVERGYAGYSLWDWHKLPDYIDPRYTDYARTNASIGINAVVLNNVNAHALLLTKQYLVKVAALADIFRPYGIQVFLSVKFSAPIEIGGLQTADPLDADVIAFWGKIVDDIYELMPDFGGFIVKANSEGQPGPHDYGRSHSEGANLLANVLDPKGGKVIWRAFVYNHEIEEDRVKQAYTDLVPQDGMFKDNAIVQVKNGPLDFQPREPFHPIFGAMPKTPLMLELQITQEYLGHATYLVYLAPLFKEVLDADTYCQGKGSPISSVIDGKLDGHEFTGIAGVTNIGSDRNWCGHPFAAANWYAFGRLAWDHQATSEDIADEWLRMTFSNDDHFVQSTKTMMIDSREAVVNYMTPIGLHHIMAEGHHYGPGPWVDKGRADWRSTYYHNANAEGIGFDRTSNGSNAVSQYFSPLREQFNNLSTCPEELLLWFHHLPWQHKMKSGRTLWNELCYRYNLGIEQVHRMAQTWNGLAEFVDEARFQHVKALLTIQEQDARWWRDACLLYFQNFSGLPIPSEYEQPAQTLDYYMNLIHYYVPGIPERRFR